MPIEITMPRLSDTMEQGTIVSWNVKEGDTVSAGDILGDIETDKATMDLQNFDDGTVAVILIGEGKTIGVGEIILVLAEEDEDVAEIKAAYGGASAGSASAPAVKQQEAVHTASTTDSGSVIATAVAAPVPTANGHGGRVFASPLARKVAIERGVDLGAIEGTGPGGRIVQRDVEAAARGGVPTTAPAPQPMPAPPEPARGATPVAATVPGSAFDLRDGAALQEKTVALSNMRATIAKRLVESKTTVPHYQVTVTARMDALMEQRAVVNMQLASQGVKLSVNDFLVRACALAMHSHPYINASWGSDGQSVIFHGEVNLGVAIALPIDPESGEGGGLVVATLHDADRMGLRQISTNTKALAGKARERGLTIEEMSGSTFTISNLGMFGVEHFTAIISPPNAAILAVGGAIKKPVVVTDADGNDTIGIGHEMQMTMSSDHRVIDGAMAAQYLATVKEMLETPMMLLV